MKTPALPLEFADNAAVRQDLHERLLSLNWHAFAASVARLLEAMGYADVRIAGRANWKGKNQNGGFDIEATLPGGLGSRRVIVTLKQFDEQVIYRRTVDELAGACLRVGAGEALLITTGQFAPSIEQSWRRHFAAPLAPVRLLGGDALLDKMLEHGIGVQGDNAAGGLKIDDVFFADLEAHYTGNRRADCLRPGETPLKISVLVEPARRSAKRPVQRATIVTLPLRSVTRKAAAPYRD